MLKVETKELPINEELKKKLEIICSFANVKDYEIISGSIISIKKTNIAYIKPNILKVNGNDYLIVNDSDDVFINGIMDENEYTSVINKKEKKRDDFER